MNSILSEYDDNKKTNIEYSESLQSLIVNLLNCNDVKVHTINSRVKERKSLENKIEEKGGYTCLSDITDVIGVRIITHFADEVDFIAKIIKKEFIIDAENSIDKRETLEPDKFGYLSLHYIISLKKERSELPEYKRFKNIKAELQIRSILQHTWAEIEHDIGYKSGIGVPREIKRQFSRLAGLLEIGDSEFINIRDSLKNYALKIKKDIKRRTSHIPVDAVSLLEYSETSQALRNIIDVAKSKYDLGISTRLGTRSDFALRNLLYAGIESIEQLDSLLDSYKEMIIEKCGVSAKRRIAIGLESPLPKTSIFVYTAQCHIFKTRGEEGLKEYIKIFRSRSRANDSFLKDTMSIFSK